MGSSWVSLGRRIPDDQQNTWLGESYGFWVKDTPLLVWLSALGEVIDEFTEAPAWMRALREEWNDPDFGAGAGCVFTGLETHLTDERRCSALLAPTTEALERLLASSGDYEAAFPTTRRFNLGIERGEQPRPIGVREKVGLIEVGSNFARLLRDEIASGEAAPQAFGYAPT